MYKLPNFRCMLPLAIAQSASGSVGMSCTSDFVAGVMLVIAHNSPGRDSTVRVSIQSDSPGAA